MTHFHSLYPPCSTYDNELPLHFQHRQNLHHTVNNFLQGFLKNIIQPMYTHINFHGIITKKYYALDQLTPGEHNQLLMESQIFRWACEVNVEKCSVKAKMDFSHWKRQPNPHRNV